MNMTNMTNRIRTLRCEAASAGDLALVALCDCALNGSRTARLRVVAILRRAEGAR